MRMRVVATNSLGTFYSSFGEQMERKEVEEFIELFYDNINEMNKFKLFLEGSTGCIVFGRGMVQQTIFTFEQKEE